MQNALKTLGITPNQEVSLDVLLGESFNGRLYGMNDAQMERLSALRDIVASYESHKEPEATEITCSSEAASALYPSMRMLDHEEVAVLFLNTANTVIRKETVFRGSTAEVNISSRDILSRALSCNATAVILCHNHPSGNPRPSYSDVKRTEDLKNACDAIGIRLLDHIIIAKGKYYSFSDEKVSKIS